MSRGSTQGTELFLLDRGLIVAWSLNFRLVVGARQASCHSRHPSGASAGISGGTMLPGLSTACHLEALGVGELVEWFFGDCDGLGPVWFRGQVEGFFNDWRVSYAGSGWRGA